MAHCYTTHFKTEALARLAAAGYPHAPGALTRVTRQLGIPRSTRLFWAQNLSNPSAAVGTPYSASAPYHLSYMPHDTSAAANPIPLSTKTGQDHLPFCRFWGYHDSAYI
jgi:hypothetical protein